MNPGPLDHIKILNKVDERATTNLSTSAVEKWRKPEWMPKELNDKLESKIEVPEHQANPPTEIPQQIVGVRIIHKI